MPRICKSCGRRFRPYATVPRQRYCSRIVCQKARRKAWQKEKLSSDKLYKENQADAQKAWREKNQNYWQQYRINHPEYVKRNRELQRVRNCRRSKRLKGFSTGRPRIAKMDELTDQNNAISGYYRLVPIDVNGIAKVDELLVKIEVITDRCSQDNKFL